MIFEYRTHAKRMISVFRIGSNKYHAFSIYLFEISLKNIDSSIYDVVINLNGAGDIIFNKSVDISRLILWFLIVVVR